MMTFGKHAMREIVWMSFCPSLSTCDRFRSAVLHNEKRPYRFIPGKRERRDAQNYGNVVMPCHRVGVASQSIMEIPALSL